MNPNFPVFSKFLQRWFETHWRSLLLLFFGVYIPLQVFAVVALQVWGLEGGLTWDEPMMTAIHTTATESFDRLAAIVTKCGSAWIVGPVSLAIAFIFFFQKQWRSLVYLLLTIVGCGVLNIVAKGYWHRVRPGLWESGYPLPHDFSFPSGHAMTSMSFIAALIILTWRTRWHGLTLAIGAAYVVTIAWTRLYLGVHYPSDILAGWMLAIAWAMGISALVKPHLNRT
ncbi:MAG TPA: phosphatase PAP2 family protein [Crinalium sp.]|jgi:undecaprenyl-diphosphatase